MKEAVLNHLLRQMVRNNYPYLSLKIDIGHPSLIGDYLILGFNEEKVWFVVGDKVAWVYKWQVLTSANAMTSLETEMLARISNSYYQGEVIDALEAFTPYFGQSVILTDKTTGQKYITHNFQIHRGHLLDREDPPQTLAVHFTPGWEVGFFYLHHCTPSPYIKE